MSDVVGVILASLFSPGDKSPLESAKLSDSFVERQRKSILCNQQKEEGEVRKLVRQVAKRRHIHFFAKATSSIHGILTMTIVFSEAMFARREAIAIQLDEEARSIDKRRSGETCILFLIRLILSIDQKYFLLRNRRVQRVLVR